jgi:hypothetical protein
MSKPVYQILDWDTNFENAKSRQYKSKHWCAVPNKQDGLGYGMMLRQPDGPALYGAFVSLVLVCSKQVIRHGYLTDTGEVSGYPYDAIELSVKTQMPSDLIQRCLDFCVVTTKWIKVYKDGIPVTDTARTSSGHCLDTSSPCDGLGEERKERRGEERLPEDTGKTSAAYAELISAFRKAHDQCLRVPEIMIIQAIREAKTENPNVDVAEAISSFSMAWAGAVFSGGATPMKEFRKYLRGRNTNIQKKPGGGAFSGGDDYDPAKKATSPKKRREALEAGVK